MTRSLVMVILAFAILVLVNVTAFSYLAFRDLSQKVVTERLVEGLNEASSLVAEQAEALHLDSLSGQQLTREIAPRLVKYVHFEAVLVIDGNGRIIHRETVRSGRFISGSAREPRAGQGMARNVSYQPDRAILAVPVQKKQDNTNPDTRIAIEYNRSAFDREIAELRGELYKKLAIAVVVSLVLLGVGLVYVIRTYKRNQRLVAEAHEADRLARLGMLAGGLAHEIRNPLNAMNMNVQLIQEELDELQTDAADEIRSMFESTRKEIMRLESLVSSFLAYSRPSDLVLAPLEINEFVRGLVAYLEPEFEKSGVKLVLHLTETPVRVPADEGHLRQAFLNVIQNGIQVLEPGQTLTISSRLAAGDQVLVIIQDEGPGIAPEEMENIFKAFYSTKRGGTGLGLPIAQRIAHLHNGGIKLESKVGEGTVFTFILPVEVS